jgi:hypothetical protein
MVPGAKEAVGVAVSVMGVLVACPASTVDVACRITGVSLALDGGSVGTGGVSLGVEAKIAVWVKFGVGNVNGVGDGAPRIEQAFKKRVSITIKANNRGFIDPFLPQQNKFTGILHYP